MKKKYISIKRLKKFMQVNMSLSKEFESAKASLASLKNDPGNDAKLKLYGLFKQASVGDCNTPKPGFTDMVNKYKWNAWNSLKKMSKVQNKNLFYWFSPDLIMLKFFIFYQERR